MERFGNDRPDLRYGMELKDVADLAAETEFKVFQQAQRARPPDPGHLRPGRRRAVQPQGPRRPDRVRRARSAPRGWSGSRSRPRRSTGPTAKFFPPDVQAELRERFDAKAGDLILIVADTQAVTSQALSNLRTRLAAELKLYDPKAFHYSWVVRFPLLAWDAEEGRYAAEHHPFTMPLAEDLPLLDTDPAQGPGPGLRPGRSTARRPAAARSAATTRSSSRRSSACWA